MAEFLNAILGWRELKMTSDKEQCQALKRHLDQAGIGYKSFSKDPMRRDSHLRSSLPVESHPLYYVYVKKTDYKRAREVAGDHEM